MTREPHPWAADLAPLYAQVWICLVRGVNDRRAAARHPTLATVAPGGLPRARTVVLRAADPANGRLDVHTDIHSAKISELRETPFAALHVWDQSAHLQIRLECSASILAGADVADIWARVPGPSRASYGAAPHPGQPIDDSAAYEARSDEAAFSVMRFEVNAIDALHLGPVHRRARFERVADWRGQWLVP
jgi:pyridoxamine 5'-phosphate oxidase